MSDSKLVSKRITVYTDGACRGNPGPGGWGAVMIWGKHKRELSGGESSTTNNRMELMAVIRALEALKRPAELDIYSDSSYVVQGVTKWLPNWIRRGWRRSKGELLNIDLWKELNRLKQQHRIQWHWVKGHSNDPLNDRADHLAKTAIP
ncbi:MAG: ribonuclease HI [Candidatus Electryoneaceae bacterium]|nr:ribonuclease HI [Candidatus Electryoneaceae bacterium]